MWSFICLFKGALSVRPVGGGGEELLPKVQDGDVPHAGGGAEAPGGRGRGALLGHPSLLGVGGHQRDPVDSIVVVDPAASGSTLGGRRGGVGRTAEEGSDKNNKICLTGIIIGRSYLLTPTNGSRPH
eukprot:427155-Prorocentrum_minimum.AAC.1